MISVKKFLKSAGTYFLGNVMTRLISFFLLPIYTNLLPPEDLGHFNNATSYLNIVVPVVCLEVWAAVMRFLCDHEDEEGKDRVIFNGFFLFSAGVLVYVLGFAILGFVTDLRCLVLICLYGIGLMLQNLYSYLARGKGFNQAYALSGIVNMLVNSVSNIVMILVFHMRLESLYLSMTLGLFVQFLMLEGRVHAFRAIRPRFFDKQLIGQMVRFGLPLCLNTVCYWGLSGFNIAAISVTLGLETSGIYSVAGKFTMMVAIFANCFSLAWQETVYSVGNEKENKAQLYSTVCNWCISLLLFAILLIVPAVKLVFPIMVGKDYSAAAQLIPLYMFATGISTFSGFLGNIFGAEKKTGSLFYTTLVAAIFNIGCYLLLYKSMGLHAANIGLSTGYVINIALRIYELKKLFPEVKLFYGRILLLLALHVPVFWIYDSQPIWINVLTAAIIFLVMLFVFRKDILGFVQKLKANKAE